MFFRKRAERELDDEIRGHLAMETQRRIDLGASPEDARRAALADFGSVALVAEVTRDMWGRSALARLADDIRYAFRLTRRNPGMATVAVISLALGIGATTSIFGVLNAIAIRPMPVKDPSRLVILQPEKQGHRWVLFNPMYEGIQRDQRVLESMFAVSDTPYAKAEFDGAAPVYVSGSFVTTNYFTVLGLAPAAGRFFQDGDPGCPVVVSHAVWTERFHRDPSAIGGKVRVQQTDCVMIGVAPASYAGHEPGARIDVWAPMRQVMDPKLFDNHNLAFFSGVMGRLPAGTSAERAESELTALYQRLQAAEPPPPSRSGAAPTRPADLHMRILPGGHGLNALSRQFQQPLVLVLALAGIVLLIGAVNVANLLMARGAARSAEFVTRAALGAGRARLLCQLLVEAALLAGTGGAMGIALAIAATPTLGSLVSLSYLRMHLDTRPDWRVAAAAVAATLIAVLVGGLLPAIRLSRASIISHMAGAGRAKGARSGRRIAGALVVAQLSLSLLLISAAGLLGRTMTRIAAVDPGFRPDHVVMLEVANEGKGVDKARAVELYGAVEARLNALPGVRMASVGWLGVFSGSDLGLRLLDPERPDDKRNSHVDYVSANYFETMGMQILRGRSFAASDRDGAPPVAVVNDALVRQRFAGREPVGRRLALDYQGEDDKPFTVVGIVRDSKYNDLRESKTEPMLWAPLAQAPFGIRTAALRVQPGMEAAVARQAEAAIRAADPRLMVRHVSTLADRVDEVTARERLMMGLAASFGWLALLLSAIGLAGTLACAVARRTPEIGLRLALGARPAQLLLSVVREACVYVVCSLAIGLPAAQALGSWLTPFLFGVTPLDVPALAGACTLLAATAVIAAWIPARRASGVDPLTALRYE